MPFPFSKPHVMVASKLVEDLGCIPGEAMKPSSPDRDEEFMELALEQARVAASRGEVPVGAVLVREDHILAAGHNNREERQNPTAHAEISAIQEGAKQLGTWRLSETILYVTLEPCLMCVGAIIQARIPRLVFGAMDPKGGACGSLFQVHEEPRLNHQVTVLSGVLEEDCRTILQSFFQELRLQESTLAQ